MLIPEFKVIKENVIIAIVKTYLKSFFNIPLSISSLFKIGKKRQAVANISKHNAIKANLSLCAKSNGNSFFKTSMLSVYITPAYNAQF